MKPGDQGTDKSLRALKEPRRALKKNTHIYICIFFLRRSPTISSIYCLNRKHSLRKTSYLPNHICNASAVYPRRKLTFTAIFLVRL